MKIKRPYPIVKHIADQLVEKFNEKNAVTRIEIAGSLRRLKPEVGDIELIAIPRPVVNLFGEPTDTTYVDLALEEWGVEILKNGKKYSKRSGFPLNEARLVQFSPRSCSLLRRRRCFPLANVPY